jgi:raffinose/stachyose/melibiose transport system permease protein
LPTQETFSLIENYLNGIEATNFWHAFYVSLRITIPTVIVILLFNSMAAWYITRVKSTYSKVIYYSIIASFVIPFQMIMFPMSKVSNALHLDNLNGIILINLGFGSGLALFMFAGFVKSIPLDIEESATIDGCNPLQLFFLIVFPILKPITITVAILTAMWSWNDYLLPYLLIGTTDNKTIPIAIQFLNQSYGSRDMGALMATLILAIVPIVLFYGACQKYIIKGVVAGAIKG